MEGGWNEDGKRMVKVGKKDKCKRKSRIKEGVYSSRYTKYVAIAKMEGGGGGGFYGFVNRDYTLLFALCSILYA